ncbi:hypothetical protein C6P08_08260 [Weissella confusa]|uniref:glycosyltransferase family 2 protein n=1 Tax=Weissella confusa TaxID=1583 RepID=UPI0010927D73|nr:glycosyltransferase family A protein [Weissella confusa]MBJ7694716.1 glycosyltransferase family 2 protein [Weissella confusa]QBZ05189.1 hypothetical protein C6P08_08260 [Weissella confusa]
MNNEKVLTITIPSYNVENYLDNILGKLMTSNYLDLLDIIVVDDGSKDNTAKVANKIAKKAPNSIRVISKQNGGHGSTINTGIQNAVGKYFKVVDADDWLDTNNLNRVIELLMEESADLLLFPYWTFDDQTKQVKLVNSSKLDLTENVTFTVENSGLKRMPEFHQHVIKTQILKDNNIIIDEHAYYVDTEFIIFPIPFINSIKFVNIPLYVYRINLASQSTSMASLIKNKERHGFVIDQIQQYISGYDGKLPAEKKRLMVNTVSRMIAAQLKIISLGPVNSSTYAELVQYMNKVKAEYSFNESVINVPIKLLIATNLRIFPVIKLLTYIKSKLVRV